MEPTDEINEVEENLDEVLEKEEAEAEASKKPGCSPEALFAVVKENLYVCKECKTPFIKRKEKLACPICHSENVISGAK